MGLPFIETARWAVSVTQPPWCEATEGDKSRHLPTKGGRFSTFFRLRRGRSRQILHLPFVPQGQLEISQLRSGWTRNPITPRVPEGTTETIRFICQRTQVPHVWDKRPALSTKGLWATACKTSYQPSSDDRRRSTIARWMHNVKTKHHNYLLFAQNHYIQRIGNLTQPDFWAAAICLPYCFLVHRSLGVIG
jgi:hypothetical protein